MSKGQRFGALEKRREVEEDEVEVEMGLRRRITRRVVKVGWGEDASCRCFFYQS